MRTEHLLWCRLGGAVYNLDAQAQSLLRPLLAPTPVAGLHPQVGEPREAIPRTLQEQPDAVLVGDLGAVNLRLENQPLCVHQQVALSALHLLAAVVAPLLPTYPRRLRRLGVYDVPALGCGSLPICDRKRSRSPAFMRSRVPSMRHLLNQS
jgi:hypothetical protein